MAPPVSVVPRPAAPVVAAGGPPPTHPLAIVEQLYDDEEYKDVETAEDVIEIPPLNPCPGPPPVIGFQITYPHEKIMTGAQLVAEHSDQFVRMMQPNFTHQSTFTWKLGLNTQSLNTAARNGAGLYFAHASALDARSILAFGQTMYRIRVPPNAWVIAEATKGWFRAGAVYLEELSSERATSDLDRVWVEDVLAVRRDLTAYHRLPAERRIGVVTQPYVRQLTKKNQLTWANYDQIPRAQQCLYTRPSY